MQFQTMTTLLIGASCFASALAWADEPRRAIELSGAPNTIRLARQYIAAYQALDIKKLASFYAPGVRFIDPTSEDTPLAQPFIFKGRDTVLSALEQAAQSFVCFRYDVRRIYESSGHVVFAGKSQGVIKTDQGNSTIDGSIVTIVTIRNGLVVEHRDYYDYPGIKSRPRPQRLERVKRRVCRQGAGLPHDNN